MNKKQFVYIISSLINILVLVNVLPFDILRLNLSAILLFNIIRSDQEEKSSDKVKKITTIDWCILLIWLTTSLTGYFIRK